MPLANTGQRSWQRSDAVQCLSGTALTSGIEEHKVDGVRVRVTTPARTVVDCFKFR
jgi:hypothetical protein